MKAAPDKLDLPVWIAVSRIGHIAPFLGYALTRKALIERCEREKGFDLIGEGYRPLHVRLVKE